MLPRRRALLGGLLGVLLGARYAGLVTMSAGGPAREHRLGSQETEVGFARRERTSGPLAGPLAAVGPPAAPEVTTQGAAPATVVANVSSVAWPNSWQTTAMSACVDICGIQTGRSPGGDLVDGRSRLASPVECCASCARHDLCDSWSYELPKPGESTGVCWLKGPGGSGAVRVASVVEDVCVSGTRPIGVAARQSVEGCSAGAVSHARVERQHADVTDVDHSSNNTTLLLFEERHDQYSKQGGGEGQHRAANRNLLQLIYGSSDPSAMGRPLRGNALRLKLHQLLLEVSKQLTSCAAPWLVWSGTLLGAWRHHGIIPWDTDVDILIEHGTLSGLLQCLKRLPRKHLVWVVRHGKHSDVIPLKVIDSTTGYFVDIFECYPDSARELCMYRLDTPPTGYRMANLFPTRTCLFDGKSVQCPNTPLNVLMQTFARATGLRSSLDVPKDMSGNVSAPTFTDVLWE